LTADTVVTSNGTGTLLAFNDNLVTLLGAEQVTISDFIWDLA
jgi:hypothetical protein